MIDRSSLTKVLAGFVSRLEDDLRVRSDEVDEVRGVVEGEWESARAAGRTDHSLEVWREGLFTQVAVGWVLASVFVRFSEDNRLIPDPLLSGPSGRGRVAEDGQTVFYREHPSEGDRGFLLHVFHQVAGLPGLSEVLGSQNPVWLFGPSDDACRELIGLWREVDPESGDLRWDFTNPVWDTRFLGDLYQDLSESARKQFALLQTPDFVEGFILDRTLDPALEEFGLIGFRMIDPACGSGHFLLGAFERLFERWRDRDPSVGDRALAARALESVFGVDLNPFAVAIARFRLLVAALKAAGINTLAEAPMFHLNVAAGDSLLHGPPPGQQVYQLVDEEDPATRHLFATEDGNQVNEILSQKYHAVVANPPYITPKDPAANAAYRRRYRTCHRQYALTVPFMERLFDLAVRGDARDPAGFVGQITANSFMKREFGKKLIEEFLATEADLTHVIDTSGAYIPGHGTPTVILFGRNQGPVGPHVRAVLGIRGEPTRPAAPIDGLVWTSIVRLADQPGKQSDYVSVDNTPRERLSTHPWSLQGGGAMELKALIEQAGRGHLGSLVDDAGAVLLTRADEAFEVGRACASLSVVGADYVKPYLVGEQVRDWSCAPLSRLVAPYDPSLGPHAEPSVSRFLWANRRLLEGRVAFGKTQLAHGHRWYEYSMLFRKRALAPAAIHWSDVATHNHFSLRRGSVLANSHAPCLILPELGGTDECLGLLGPLNSSVGCFWMKQVFHNKGSTVDQSGARQTTAPFENFYEFDGTKLKKFPLPARSPTASAQRLDELAAELSESLPGTIAEAGSPARLLLDNAHRRVDDLRRLMVSVQEELDWRCYFLYGLTSKDVSLAPEKAPPIEKGERAFEIALARRMVAGEVETSWFERHGSTPITELPERWSESYKRLVERRLELIESDRFINLVERPEYKRRWNWDDWDDLEHDTLQGWLLDRLEAESLWSDGRIKSAAEVADWVRTDTEFVQVAGLYAKSPEVDLTELVGKLVANEAVPFLAAWRYTEPGLRKRAEWEKTWALQRREDAGEDLGDIPVPPKYAKTDFRSGVSWSLRGKLDVPKERFVSYPGLNRDTDPTLLIGWAGWDHLEQATALAELYEQRRTVDAWQTDQLLPVLAGIDELVPWVIQWHNDPDPASGQRLGDFFNDFVAAECHTLGIPRNNLTNWQPPNKTNKRKKGNATTS